MAVVELFPELIILDTASKYEVPTSLWCFTLVYPSFSLENSSAVSVYVSD